jgi:hypothetical protein
VRTAGEHLFGVSIEDVAPGAPIQPLPGKAWHHVAVWCDDLATAAAKLEQNGYRKEVVGRGPNGELTIFAYMVSDRGPRLELADVAIKPEATARFAANLAAEGDKPAGELFAPLSPCEIAVVVGSARRLDALRACWREALAAQWGEVTDKAITVKTPDGDCELRTLSVSTSTDPCVTIIAPQSGAMSLLQPAGGGGWHHLTFKSGDLANDAAWLERWGFVMEFWGNGEKDHPQDFAMLASPEGTRVKLVQVVDG